MSQCGVIFIENPPPLLVDDRQSVYKIFNKFGDIVKLYCDKEHKKLVKVYYSDLQASLQAYEEINLKPPLFLTLRVGERTLHHINTKSNRNRFSSNHLNSSTRVIDDCSSTNSNMGEEEVEVVSLPTTFLYDIFGKEISILQDDNNHAYVSVEELRRHNFPLFDESKQPAPITEEDYLQELRVYLTFKARKFQSLHREQVITPSTSTSIINEVINDYKNLKPLTAGSKLRNPLNSGKQNINKNIQKPLNGISNDARKTNSTNIECLKSRNDSEVPEAINIVPMPLNTPIEVLVTYGVNEHRCYVYLKSRQENMDTLLRKVEIEAKKSTPEVNPIVGNIYAAMFDGAWYRVIVQGVNPLQVQYIDFGNYNNSPVKEVRRLSEALSNFPWEAVCINFGSNPIPGKLNEGSVLNIIAQRQNSDCSYQVKKASEEKNERKSFNNTNKNNDQNGNVGKFEMNAIEEIKAEKKVVEAKKVDEPKKVDDLPKIESPTVSSTSLNSLNSLKEGLIFRKAIEKKVVNPSRRTILEVYNSSGGVVQYIGNVEGNHIACLFPLDAMEDLDKLENLADMVTNDHIYDANLGDTVIMYECDDDGEKKFYRGTIIEKKNDNYHIALIDYGKIAITSTVYKLDKNISDIGECCCVCDASEKFLNEKENVTYKVLSTNQIQLKFSDGSEEVLLCTIWNPIRKNAEEVNPKEIEPIFRRPQQMELSNGELCKISNVIPGKLLVKTKDCLDSYKKIMKSISEHSPQQLENSKVSQIALCSYNNSEELYRVIILNINDSKAEVEYLDLGVTGNVNINSLKNIPESLATTAITIIPITLLGYEKNDFNEKELEIIYNMRKNSTRFIANIVSRTPLTYDLIELEKESLTKTLEKLNRFLYKDMQIKDKTGKVNVLCLDNSDSNTVVFIDDESLNQLALITDAVQNFQYKEPYVPVEDEICFASYDDEWNRVRVLEANANVDTFKVVFIDYGTVSTTSSANIRRINDDLKTIPNLSLICNINDLNGREINIGKSYTISILKKDDNGVYTVDLV